MSESNSALSSIIAQIESSNGANNASQPASMANPTYGQYPSFVAQYGSGAAGVDNYASQMLAANPNATLADFYAGYAISTGNPANPPSVEQLQTQYPDYYNNLANNSGVALDTPLSTLVNSPMSNGTVDASSGLNAGPNATVDPTNPASAFGVMSPFNMFNPFGVINQGIGAAAGQAGAAASNALGLSDIATAIDQSFASMIQGITSWFARGFLIIIGLALIVVGLAAMLKKEIPVPA